MKSILTLLTLIVLLVLQTSAGQSFPDETIDEWHGFKRHNFQVDGCAAWVVEPKTALAGNPWS